MTMSEKDLLQLEYNCTTGKLDGVGYSTIHSLTCTLSELMQSNNAHTYGINWWLIVIFRFHKLLIKSENTEIFQIYKYYMT